MNKTLKNSLCTALLFAATALFLPATATNSAAAMAISTMFPLAISTITD